METLTINSVTYNEKVRISGISKTDLSVMIVEDETMISIFLSEILVDLGYNVCGIASNETDAVTMAAKCSPDLIIADAKLQSGTGISAIRRILQTNFIPHVLISGYRLNELALHPYTVFLEKPFSQAALQKAISKAFLVMALPEKHKILSECS